MGNTVSCCWNSRNPEKTSQDAEEKNVHPKIRNNNNFQNEILKDDSLTNSFSHDEEINSRIRKNTIPNNLTQCSEINVNADDSQNDFYDPDIKNIVEYDLMKDKESFAKNELDFNNVYLKISIDSLNLKYENIDEYGTSIKPYVEMFLEDKCFRQIRVENNSNISITSLNNSNNSNISLFKNSFNQTNNINDENNANSKIFQFSFSEYFELNEIQTYGVIFISLKNENGNFTSESTPNITIGSAYIPIRSLLLKYFNNEFYGHIEIFSKEVCHIGSLKINFKLSNQIPDNNNILFETKFKDIKEVNLDISNSLNDTNNIYKENKFYHHEIFENKILQKYFNADDKSIEAFKSYNLNFLSCQNINNEEYLNFNSFKDSLLFDMYQKGVSDKNLILLHMFFILLNKICVFNETEIGYNYVFDNFLSILNKNSDSHDKEASIYNIGKTCEYNCYIIKNYYRFIFYYIKYIRNHKNIKTRKKFFFDESILISKVAETIKNLNDKFKKESSTEGYKLEVISSIIFGFNILIELCTAQRDIKEGLSKEELSENNEINFTKVYKNCIEIISKRYSFLRLIEVFSNNSQILSFITRIFRKVIQMIFTPGREVKRLESISQEIGIHPKDLVNYIRVRYKFIDTFCFIL